MKNTLRHRILTWIRNSEKNSEMEWLGFLEGTRKVFSNCWCAYGALQITGDKQLVFFERNVRRDSYSRKKMSFNEAKRLALKELQRTREYTIKTYFI